jgi:hypothetical protein
VVGETDSEGVACYLPNFGKTGVPMGKSAGKRLRPPSARRAKYAGALAKRLLTLAADRRARVGLRSRP